MSKERAAFRKAAASASPRWRELVATEMLGSKWGRLGEEHRALMLAAGGEEVELEQQEFRKGDVLVVVDMQNDFIPGAKGGGRLGTSEGKQISPLICDLIAAAAASGARIVATRDYHPRSHFSFDANGGCLPVHCVQGCPGSHFFPPIAEALDRARKERTPPHPPRPSPTCCFTASDRSVTPVRQLTTPRWRRTDPGSVDVVFKGFVQQADSFGSVKYSAEDFQKKAIGMKGVTPMTPICGCSALDWTGSFVLGASNLEVSRTLILPRAKLLQAERGDLKHRVLVARQGDINAPPDVMAVYERTSLGKMVGEARRLFSVGLCYDLCVIDTALNAAPIVPEVYLVGDASRAVHIPGVGQFGSGFLNDPAHLVSQMKKTGVKICRSPQLLVK